MRETENLVRKALKGEGGAASGQAPELTVVSEVLRTKAVHVQLQQKTSGKGRLIVEFADADTRDAVIAAIKEVAELEKDTQEAGSGISRSRSGPA